MGRELSGLLAQRGAHVALCDINDDELAESVEIARSVAAGDATVSAHRCDVTDVAAVERFVAEVAATHGRDDVNLLFNNAGIAGGGSVVTNDNRAAWDATFDVCWNGVLNCTRAFLGALRSAEAAAIINTSSINGFWATVGPDLAHTAYCAAKFAVKGFTEALMVDLALNAPHISAHVVMPGHIGTAIARHSTEFHGGVDVAAVRKYLAERGVTPDTYTDEQLIELVEARNAAFETAAPTTAAQAAEVIVDAVLAGRWRILVGDDAVLIDEMVRAEPEAAYTDDFLARLIAAGHLENLARRRT